MQRRNNPLWVGRVAVVSAATIVAAMGSDSLWKSYPERQFWSDGIALAQTHGTERAGPTVGPSGSVRGEERLGPTVSPTQPSGEPANPLRGVEPTGPTIAPPKPDRGEEPTISAPFGVEILDFGPSNPKVNELITISFRLTNLSKLVLDGFVYGTMDEQNAPFSMRERAEVKGLQPGKSMYDHLTTVLATSGPHELKVNFYPSIQLGNPARFFGAALQISVIGYPRYNEVYGVATHNSYWINREASGDLYAGGTQELLSDQLLHEHVRAIELDVHSQDAPPGQWLVYHTSEQSYSHCNPLRDCLEMLRSFHYALPSHEAVNVVVELKNTGGSLAVKTPHNFDSTHTIRQFDATFLDVLGRSNLYTPEDFLNDCAKKTGRSGQSMRWCAEFAKWPTIDQLRGKFIINIMGNWGNAIYDWAHYANEGKGIIERVAFPFRCIFDAHGGGVISGAATLAGGANYDEPAPGWLATANDASVFWQVENFEFPEIGTFLSKGGIVRGKDSYDYCWNKPQNAENPTPLSFDMPVAFLPYQCYPAHEDRIRRGFQLIQTDYPWNFVKDHPLDSLGIPTDPSRRYADPTFVQTVPQTRGDAGSEGDLRNAYWARAHRQGSPEPVDPASAAAYEFASELWASRKSYPVHPDTLLEPGYRQYFHVPENQFLFAYEFATPGERRFWETTVSSTRRGDTWEKLGTPFIEYRKRPFIENAKGCLVMAQSRLNSMQICRRKHQEKDSQGGDDSKIQEQIVIEITTVHSGSVKTIPYFADLEHTDQIGNFIALEVEERGGQSFVTAFSAGILTPSWTPKWKTLMTDVFPGSLNKHGLSASGDVLFAGTRVREGGSDSPSRFITLCNLSNFDGSSDGRVVDLSHPRPPHYPCAQQHVPLP